MLVSETAPEAIRVVGVFGIVSNEEATAEADPDKDEARDGDPDKDGFLLYCNYEGKALLVPNDPDKS